MMYSCFNPGSGLYDYFESPDGLALNADLPVPNHLTQEIKGIGVPSIVAGRPMPSNAQSVGSGWHARGMVVNCGRGPLGADDGATGASGAKWVVFVLSAAAGAMLFLSFARPRRT